MGQTTDFQEFIESTADVSAVGRARIRLSGGVLQQSLDGAAWTTIGGGGGSGTVTSVAATAGGLLAIAGTPTVAPTVGLAAAAANTIIANATSGSAVPTAVTLGENLSFSAGTLVAASQFGTDTTLQLPDSGATLVNSWQGINDLTITTPGATTSRYVMKMMSAGTLTDSFNLTTAALTLPGQVIAGVGSAANPSFVVGQAGLGIYKAGSSDLGFTTGGALTMHLSGNGFAVLNLVGSNAQLQFSSGGANIALSTGSIAITPQSTFSVKLVTDAGTVVQANAAGDHSLGVQSALATNATAGFPYMRNSAGAPTGVPSLPFTGQNPFQYDETNHKFWVYDRGAAAWKGIVLT